ncbi:hypothetical protein PIB30_062570, partial [Stylosanthes scabra]|nr:hypothetical protein [Stylosanthes scabra]
MRELPLSMLETLSINREQQVKCVFDAITHTQPTSLRRLQISHCSSTISFPRNSLPPSLRELCIHDCKNVEFPMHHQQHHSLQRLRIYNSCDSLTSFKFPAFPNLIYLGIQRCENLTSLEEVSQLRSLQELSIQMCPELHNIKVPASLRELRIIRCPLLGEGIEKKDTNIWSTISHIPTIYVDEKLILNDSTSLN